MKSLFTDYKVSQQTSERKNLKFRFGDYFCSFEERFFQKVFLGADLKISARDVRKIKFPVLIHSHWS